ncbi:unnamed protein product [Ectocarpus sp. CCAP 1310/34]|nr:unnamed protein product [Ectocarpus sp. CCAP 1310/34]
MCKTDITRTRAPGAAEPVDVNRRTKQPPQHPLGGPKVRPRDARDARPLDCS